MSMFSEKLKLIIEESGMKIYQLAKNAELDRTTIQRSITGERLPSLNFVEKLSEYLRLSHNEKTELFDLYSIAKIGEKVYYQRKYIKEIIERMATVHTVKENISSIQKGVSFTKKIRDNDSVFTGQYIVNNLVRNVLEYEAANNSSPEINIFVPFDYNFLFDLLYQLYLSENGEITIKNIIRFIKSPHSFQNSNYNLEILSHVLPFAFSAGNGYQPYYFYDNFDINNDIALLMPYYIITSKHLITLSSDFNTAILYTNESIVNAYKESFKLAITKSKALIAEHFSCDDMLLAYLESHRISGVISHVIEPQPCFAYYYTDDLIESHLRQDLENKEMLLNLLYNLYRSFRNYATRPMSIFSIEGLKYFVDTGILSDLPTQFAIPFTLDERIMLLSKLRNDIAKDDYKVYAVNSLKFIIPLSSIQLYNTNELDFFTSDNNGSLNSSFIKEKSITEAFYDFFESLPGSDLVYSKEETIKIIDSFIEQCRAVNCKMK